MAFPPAFAPGRLLRAQLEERFDRWVVKTAPVTLEAAEQDLVIEQGRRVRLALEWRELRGDEGTEGEAVQDLESWTFRLAGARDYGGAPLIDLTGAVAGDDPKYIEFVLEAADSAALTGWSRGVYDITATKGTQVVRLVRGRLTRSPAAVDPEP